MHSRPVGRLAPSPTGALHLGHAFSFLLAYWTTKSRGGRLVLRLEDVDVERAAPEHVARAEEDLAWLGVEWDGAPRLQSTGLPRLVEAAEKLQERGLAYPCVCTRGELRAAGSAREEPGAPQAGPGEPRYPGTCRGRFSSLEEAERVSGRAGGLRLCVPEESVVVVDRNYGELSFDVAREVGDFLILRRNKTPAYQLAVVVDDAFDGVTEVIRGADLLPSAARQILVQRALGLPGVSYLHTPLVTNAEGRRLAKREADLGLFELREAGVDPRAIVAWVAHASGQLPGETGQRPRCTAAEVLPHFRAERIGKAPLPLTPAVLEDLRSAR